MKRRTRLRFISCAAICGTFSIIGPALAGATESVGIDQPMVNSISDSPPAVVHAPTGEVTVEPGDSLTTIGTRTSRSWEQLAGFNHLPNPNLIYPDQVLTIPPEDYVPPSYAALIPAPQPVSVSAPAPAPVTPAPAPAPVAAPSEGGIPPSWQATAQCENGGANDPNYGYFGIKEWNGFDGYPSAGSAPLSVQLQWEATYIGSPPDAPGECHSY